MIKAFCDRCNVEITDANKAQTKANTATFTRFNDDRLGGSLEFQDRSAPPHVTKRYLTFIIMTGTDTSANTGHYCKHCIIDAVKSLDDRAPINSGVTYHREVTVNHYVQNSIGGGGGGGKAPHPVAKVELAPEPYACGFAVGDEVVIYDRYRFALPLRAEIAECTATAARVKLWESNNPSCPVGCEVWVLLEQLRRAS